MSRIETVMLLHGIGGNRTGKSDDYFQYLDNECKKMGVNCVIPSMPRGAEYETWREEFNNGGFDKSVCPETLVLAQSLGTQFFVKYLCEKAGKISGNDEVGAYISCAGMKHLTKVRDVSDNLGGSIDTSGNERAEEFLVKTVDSFKVSDKEYKCFKNFKFPKVSIYGGRDLFYSKDNLEAYADAIGAKKVFLKERGHFSGVDGHTEFPEALDLVKAKLVNRKSKSSEVGL